MYTKRRFFRKRKTRRGGANWFITRPKEPIEKRMETECETDCMKAAKQLCDTTCRKAALRSLDENNSIISKKLVEDTITENKNLKNENIKLEYKIKDITRELDMIKKVYKI